MLRRQANRQKQSLKQVVQVVQKGKAETFLLPRILAPSALVDAGDTDSQPDLVDVPDSFISSSVGNEYAPEAIAWEQSEDLSANAETPTDSYVTQDSALFEGAVNGEGNDAATFNIDDIDLNIDDIDLASAEGMPNGEFEPLPFYESDAPSEVEGDFVDATGVEGAISLDSTELVYQSDNEGNTGDAVLPLDEVTEIADADLDQDILGQETDDWTVEAASIDPDDQAVDSGVNAEDLDDPDWPILVTEIEPGSPFQSGQFVVGETGEVGIDFLFDGGAYQGELGIFSLSGMPDYDPDAPEVFIREAVARVTSNSELGYIVIQDFSEGARFSGNMHGEGNFNSGDYLGVKTFQMRPGDEFAVVLIPNGTFQEVLDNPLAQGSQRPLFSLALANPNETFHTMQIVDVTGTGNTFAMEDLRTDGYSDRVTMM